MFTFAANEFIAARNAYATENKGIILTVTPRNGEQGTVSLDIKQKLNDVGGPSPRRSTRRASGSARRRPPWSC
jgi:type II secretory pathway component GspD/PulD (secretin)